MSDDSLSDAEIALMDAIKALMEIMMTAGIAKPAAFDFMLTHQRNGYLSKRMPTAAAVMEMLRTFATDPQRDAQRQELRANLQRILEEPPQGTA